MNAHVRALQNRFYYSSRILALDVIRALAMLSELPTSYIIILTACDRLSTLLERRALARSAWSVARAEPVVTHRYRHGGVPFFRARILCLSIDWDAVNCCAAAHLDHATVSQYRTRCRTVPRRRKLPLQFSFTTSLGQAAVRLSQRSPQICVPLRLRR